LSRLVQPVPELVLVPGLALVPVPELVLELELARHKRQAS